MVRACLAVINRDTFQNEIRVVDCSVRALRPGGGPYPFRQCIPSPKAAACFVRARISNPASACHQIWSVYCCLLDILVPISLHVAQVLGAVEDGVNRTIGYKFSLSKGQATSASPASFDPDQFPQKSSASAILNRSFTQPRRSTLSIPSPR